MKFVKFKDAFKAGYTISKVTSNGNIGTSSDMKPNILLSRKNTDYNNFYKNALISINGHFHITDTDGINGVIVIDGGKSLSISKQNQIGIHSFKSIGNIKILKIDNNNLFTNNDGTVKINITESLVGKTVLISICGYLTFQEGMKFYSVGDNLFKIDFNNLNILDRFYELLRYIDLSSLPILFSPNNNNQISKDQLLSDENLKALLNLSQSFIVIVDTPNLNISREYIKRTGIPGSYLCYKKPELPLVCGLGRYTEYWDVKDNGVYNISVYDNIVDNKLYNTNISMTSVDNSLTPVYSYKNSNAYFIKITN